MRCSVRPYRRFRFVQGLCLVLAVAALAPAARAQILPSFGGDRAGTSGFQFLKLPVDARGSALSQTVVANAFDASALFWNPALAAQTSGFQAGLHHTRYFEGINLDYLAAHYTFPAGLMLGASLQALGTDDMAVTTELEPFGTGQSFRFASMALGLSMGQRLTDLFSYGVTAKWVRESTAGLNTDTGVLDLGIFYRVGETGVQMAVMVRSFGLDGRPDGTIERIDLTGVLTESSFESVAPPTTFLFGITYNPLQRDSQQDMLLSLQLINPSDNIENWNIGVEYSWNALLFVRTGYRFGITEYTAPSAGIGIGIPFLGPEVRFDYGFSRLERLGSIHQVGLNIAL